MKRGIISIMVVCTLAFCALPAEAALVTIEIEAVVDYVEDDAGHLEGKINPGDIITGSYTYDSSTPDSIPSYPTVGRYEHYASPCGIFLNVGGFEFRTDSANVDFLVGIGNNVPSTGLHDSYWLHSYNNLILSNDTLVDEISWSLRDYSSNALSSIALPTTAPVLDDWQSRNRLCLEAYRTYLVEAHVTSAIPEPATIVLLGLGGLILRRRN